MKISDYISKDVNALALNNTIGDAKKLFNILTFSHLPIVENNTLLGLIDESDVRTVENDDETLENHRELLNTFFIGMENNWMEILKIFSFKSIMFIC